MSLNWVQRTENGLSNGVPFIQLPLELVHHAQKERVTFKLIPVGQQNPEEIILKGHMYVTNQRLLILADQNLSSQTQENDNFLLLFSDIISHKLEMPWFGSNKYQIQFRVSNANGGLNYLYPWVLTIEFPYGGAIKFNEEFTRLLNDYKDNDLEPLPMYTEN